MNLLCFSHLRWDFVYQRPQHLMSRFAKEYTTYFIEEPFYHEYDDDYKIVATEENVTLITPHLNKYDSGDINKRLQNIIHRFLKNEQIINYIAWYYTPMALLFTQNLKPVLTVYDCMDELSAFKFAPPQLLDAEKELLNKADVVFTGGHSLYKAKKYLHHNIYPFPSSIDKTHFEQARTLTVEPEDQQHIPHPRLGFFGVIDERFDIDLISKAATEKSHWHFVLIGPVVKISEDELPRNANIHYLGSKDYKQLPAYISGWDVALIPFAINDSTRFISPTKTPEYLAAGKPVISTPIEDVVHPYHDNNLVHIINSADEFLAAVETEFQNGDTTEWLKKTDAFLAGISWDDTWMQMQNIINKTIQNNTPVKNKQETYV